MKKVLLTSTLLISFAGIASAADTVYDPTSTEATCELIQIENSNAFYRADPTCENVIDTSGNDFSIPVAPTPGPIEKECKKEKTGTEK